MYVRRLTVADLAAFRALHRFGMTESPAAIVDTAETDAARTDSEVATTLGRGEGWGVFEGDRLLGKLTIDALAYPSLAHTFWIHALYLHPEGRGSGAGVALMRAAMEDARTRGASRVALWVNGRNEHALRLYERLGFRETGRIPGGIYVDRKLCDDVLMTVVLE